MKMNDEKELPVSQEVAWNSLNDIALLKQCIPGCESILLKEDGTYELLITAAIGPVKAKFKGQMRMKDIAAPTSYTLEFNGQGGAVGFGKGEAQVSLSPIGPATTLLRYSASASVGGKLAQVGARLIDMAAQKVASEFFDAFLAELKQRYGQEPAASQAASTVADSATPQADTAALGEQAVPASPVAAEAASAPAASVEPRKSLWSWKNFTSFKKEAAAPQAAVAVPEAASPPQAVASPQATPMTLAAELLGGRAVAIVGVGLVGRGWAVVFARAGIRVRLHDANLQTLHAAPAMILKQLEGLEQNQLLKEGASTVMARISCHDTLDEAVSGTAYVQESILERVELKRELLEKLQALDDGRRLIGSSTSGIPASQFTSAMAIAPRVLIVHPVNPPSLVPLVELVPSPATSGTTLAFAKALMEALGQSAITVNKEIEGFVLNRLQAVLLREAWALVAEGVASAEDVDKTVRDGLGWRWSFMGPFETIDLNAVGGVADYARRLGPLYQRIAAARSHDAPWDEGLIATVEAQLRSKVSLEAITERSQWRDQQLMAFSRHRTEST